MNELIKQFMDQAGIDVEAVENLGEMPTAMKFAELIIRECMAVGFAAVATIDDGCHAVDVYDSIKDHFGVKE